MLSQPFEKPVRVLVGIGFASLVDNTTDAYGDSVIRLYCSQILNDEMSGLGRKPTGSFRVSAAMEQTLPAAGPRTLLGHRT